MRRVHGSPVRSGAGFTMIEMLITILILSILLGMAIPAFSTWLPNYRLRGAARDLYSNLHLIKSRAIRDRGEWAIKFNAADNSYQIVSGGPDRLYSTPEDNGVHKTVSLSDYGSVVTFGAGSSSPPAVANAVTANLSNPIIFNSRGFAVFGGGTDPSPSPVLAYMTNKKGTAYAIGILASGVVVLKKWNGKWE